MNSQWSWLVRWSESIAFLECSEITNTEKNQISLFLISVFQTLNKFDTHYNSRNGQDYFSIVWSLRHSGQEMQSDWLPCGAVGVWTEVLLVKAVHSVAILEIIPFSCFSRFLIFSLVLVFCSHPPVSSLLSNGSYQSGRMKVRVLPISSETHEANSLSLRLPCFVKSFKCYKMYLRIKSK